MASRDLVNFRRVTEQVVENKSSVLEAGAEITANILKRGAEAKMAESVSQAQLAISELQSQYKIDNEGNPMGGLEKYKQDRQKIFDQFGKDISPIYKRQFDDTMRQIAQRNDITQQAWAIKQTHVNSVNQVNRTMQNNFNQAGLDGQAFGLGDETEIDAFVNFGTSIQNIERFAEGNLGSETMAGLMENYQDDYMKSFVSGIAQTNPRKALSTLKLDEVKDHFKNPEVYGKMKSSLEARVKRLDKAEKQAREATNMAGTNSLLPKIGKMSYAELQANFSEFNMSPEAIGFYEEVNGYANLKRAVNPQEKADLKNKFYIFLSGAVGKENLKNQDLQIMQDAVYAGMRKHVLSKNEGFGFLNNIMTPIIAQQQERAAKFETGDYNPFQKNLGLDSLNEEIGKLTGIANIEKPTPEQVFINQKNANLMYDVYLQTLTKEAADRGIALTELDNIGDKQEIEIYNKALNAAKTSLLRRNFPEFSGSKELPATFVQPVKPPPIDVEFSTVDEAVSFAKKAKLKDGTIIIVDGKKMEWNN